MSELSTSRQIALGDDRRDILRTAQTSNSQLTAVTDRTIQFAGLLMNSVLTGTGDYTAVDAELIISQFEVERLKVAAQLDKLNAIAQLRVLDGNGDLDPAATAIAFSSFVNTYNLDLVAISKKYDAI